MLVFFRNIIVCRVLSLSIFISLVAELIFPATLYALTGGPSQPEVQGFAPAGATDMVDLFTGDFKYNIPLLDVDGYPVNLSYNSGISMDQEASWVGLGWSLNPGAITRNMRGIPDEFNGEDIVTNEQMMKTNQTFGVNAGLGIELLGIKTPKKGGLRVGLGISYNNYTGYDLSTSLNLSVSAAKGSKGKLTGGLGVTSSSANGLTISPNVGFEARVTKENKNEVSAVGGVGVGTSINSRAGMNGLQVSKSISISATVDRVNKKGEKKSNSFSTGSIDNSSSINFGIQTYIPQVTMPTFSQSFTVSIKGGIEGWGAISSGDIGATYAFQKIRNEDRVANTPAFGYMNLHQGIKQDKVILDYNREKDGSYSLNVPTLPVTNLTYDIYSIAGQGIGGTFRSYRGDLGYVFDSEVKSHSGSNSFGGELGGGNAVHGGVDISTTQVTTKSSKWKNSNKARDILQFSGSPANQKHEHAAFKLMGELSVDDDNLMQHWGGSDPVYFKLNPMPSDQKEVVLEKKIVKGTYAGDTDLHDINSTARNKRHKRNQLISFLSIEDAKSLALNKEAIASSTYLNAFPKHHIGEFTITKDDGTRYFYGLPVYNTKQVEKSFSVDAPTSQDCINGFVTYSDQDASIENKKGLGHYYNSTILPPYAHSHMLTAIVSADYSDIDNKPGPTSGDFGSYTKFSYKKINNKYKWRVPLVNQAGKANYNEGLKSNNADQKGSYVYGEKDIVYLSTIETKNYIAIFHTSPRQDALGVDGERGIVNETVKQEKLDSIQLFTTAEYYNINITDKTPIKTVHFKYNYDLCGNVPNSLAGGKLTLEEVFFTYGKSFKGKFSPYVFEYSEQNPDYDFKAYDRWGNYKPIIAGSSCDHTGNPTNAEFPYVEQDTFTSEPNLGKYKADVYADAWNLNKIILPTGGVIQVHYEADDYAYVQNLKAMQMIKPLGFINEVSTEAATESLDVATLSQSLMNSSGSIVNNYLVFELPMSVNSNEEFRKLYLTDHKNQLMDKLYFRFFVNITTNTSSVDVKPKQLGCNFEYVSGYIDIQAANSGIYANGKAYVKICKVKLNDDDGSDCNENDGGNTHPISKAAWQFGRLNLPFLVWGQDPPPGVTGSGTESGSIIITIIKTLAGVTFMKNIKDALQGPNRTMRKNGFGMEVKLDKSWFRLYTPTGIKKGGGARVQKIEIYDNWNNMSSGNNSKYGQIYEYRMTENNRIISSGVAAYEPMAGNDENPWRMPISHGKAKNVLAPDDEFYTETPMGESFFPSPVVGYRQVTVKNLQYAEVKKNATGKVVHEFYTAYDFPTKVWRTIPKSEPKKTDPIIGLFSFKNEDYMTVSQGYSIELNDMHGKNKGMSVYQEGSSAAIYSERYNYYAEGNSLKNEVTTIDKFGNVKQNNVGVEFDVITDMREQTTDVRGGGTPINSDFFTLGPIPIIIPMVFGSLANEKTRFRSSVITKVISKYGIVKEVIKDDLGAVVTTQNLAFDAETGNLLLTKTINEYEDGIYNLTYPAHWVYEGMGMGYNNIGVTLSNVSFTGGQSSTISDAQNIFFKGDELLLKSSGGIYKVWVKEVNQSSINVINSFGEAYDYSQPNLVKIIRSGRRNQHNTPVGILVSKTNPLNSIKNNQFKDIINAEYFEYSDFARTFCDCPDDFIGDEVVSQIPVWRAVNSNRFKYNSSNPYVKGTAGNYRLKKKYLYLTERHLLASASNLRTDGMFVSFSPFWKNASNGWQKDDNNWTWTAEVTEYSPYGFELENVDPLKRYSSALYGYKQSLPTAVAKNARYKEIGFDSFEDYEGLQCWDDHFSYKYPEEKDFDFPGASVTNTQSHTGRRSIKVEAGKHIEITKIIEQCN